ncbi:hypothetical protein GWN90_28430, partial [candidate division KSB1 bacterium]|nr:hypothetical protein [candidate division KSB1 bacterium]NIV69863.1 hypothetical protein [Phycisphaerae bacterium]
MGMPPAVSSQLVPSKKVQDDSGNWFTDVTASAGIRFRNINGDSGQLPIIDQNGQGAAFLDYNGDG